MVNSLTDPLGAAASTSSSVIKAPVEDTVDFSNGLAHLHSSSSLDNRNVEGYTQSNSATPLAAGQLSKIPGSNTPPTSLHDRSESNDQVPALSSWKLGGSPSIRGEWNGLAQLERGQNGSSASSAASSSPPVHFSSSKSSSLSSLSSPSNFNRLGQRSDANNHISESNDQKRTTGDSDTSISKQIEKVQNENKAKRFYLPPWLIILSWIGLSTSVIFYNREIMMGSARFKFPITLTSLHLLYQTVATRLLHRYTDLIAQIGKINSLSSVSPPMNRSTPQSKGAYEQISTKDYDLEEGGGGGEGAGVSDKIRVNHSPILGSNADGGGGVDVMEKAAIQEEEFVTARFKQTIVLKEASVRISWKDWKRQILPPAVLFSLSLVLSNWAYLYLTTAFIHMLKAFSPVSILLAAFIFGTKAFNMKLVFIVVIISFGVGMASYGEASFNLTGFLIQFVAILIEATRVTLIQILLADRAMSPLKSLYYFAPICLAINGVLILPVEGFAALRAIPALGIQTIFFNCTLTFMLNLSAVYLIGLSSMVLSLSKVVKDILLVGGSSLLLGDKLTALQGFGYAIATAGLLWYKVSPH